jgi:hypothetical protein
MNNQGVTGGFAVGEGVRVTADVKFNLPSYANISDVFRIGLTDQTPNAGNSWDAGPIIGSSVQYNVWQDVNGGSMKFFADWSQSGQNSNAAIPTGNDVGFYDVTGATPDLESDNLRIVWQATATGADTWDLDITVSNLTTGAEWYGPTLTANYSTSSDAFVAFNSYTGGSATTIDRIMYESIPEPATIGLIGAFGGVIIFIRRRLSL